MRKSWPILVLAFAIALGVLPGRAQDGKPPEKPAEKPKKEKPPKPEDALRRAMLHVKKVEDQKFMQMTVTLSESDDDATYIAVAEFGTGDVAFFQGGADPDGDQWVMLAKKDMAMLKEIADRQSRR